jgi:hypothetical protein
MWPTLFSGAVAALALSGIVWYLRRPKLRLSAEPREPWCLQMRWEFPGNVGAVAQAFDGLKNYYRIHVEPWRLTCDTHANILRACPR